MKIEKRVMKLKRFIRSGNEKYGNLRELPVCKDLGDGEYEGETAIVEIVDSKTVTRLYNFASRERRKNGSRYRIIVSKDKTEAFVQRIA